MSSHTYNNRLDLDAGLPERLRTGTSARVSHCRPFHQIVCVSECCGCTRPLPRATGLKTGPRRSCIHSTTVATPCPTSARHGMNCPRFLRNRRRIVVQTGRRGAFLRG